MTKQDPLLEELVGRIIEAVDPEKIILFGSYGREEAEETSDLDLLVVKRGAHRRRTAQKIYMNLFGFGRSVDVIVVTPEDVERYKDSHALVLKPALEEGTILYDKESEPQVTG